MKMVPVNRMLVVRPIIDSSNNKEGSILVPEDYQPTTPHAVGEVLAVANDCKIEVEKNDKIVYDNSMVQEIQINGCPTGHLLLENYVIAVLQEG